MATKIHKEIFRMIHALVKIVNKREPADHTVDVTLTVPTILEVSSFSNTCVMN